MFTTRAIIVMTLCCMLFSCRDSQPPSLQPEGYWFAEGYGWALLIDNENYTLYDRTSISCIPRHTGPINELVSDLEQQEDTLLLRKGTSIYKFVKAGEIPEICRSISREEKNDVLHNFDVYTQTVKDHYAYLDMQDLSWDSLYQQQRSILLNNPTQVQLYSSLEEILSRLNDNHGYLEATDELYEKMEEDTREKVDTVPEPAFFYGDFQVADMASDVFIEEEYTTGNGIMRWGILRDTIGYLQVKAMWLLANLELRDTAIQRAGYTGAYAGKMSTLYEGTYIKKETEGARSLMDAVMNDLGDTRMMIIDVRFNGGGQDMVSMEILRHFNERPRPVARKKAKYRNGFTDMQTLTLPAAASPYLKPVYLLTSRQSASATDFLALASLELPNIKRIGTATQGAISDALEKELPNGWYFSVSNEIYVDMEGNCYEYKGVPPDITLEYPEDRQLFFRQIMQYTLRDKARILQMADSLERKKH